MPGFILHLTAAQMLLNQLKKDSSTGKTPALQITSENDFLIGNLLPDATTDKDKTHFRNPIYKEKMMVYPDLNRFLEKYSSMLSDDSCLGYYFHLYIDRKFFKDYIPQTVEFLKTDGSPTDIRSEVSAVLVRKSGRIIPGNEYLTEKYYYGDYTKMNSFLAEKFQLSLNLNPEIANPGITEVNYADIKEVLSTLQNYLNVPVSAIEDLTVFDIDELLKFLDNAVSEFLAKQR